MPWIVQYEYATYPKRAISNKGEHNMRNDTEGNRIVHINTNDIKGGAAKFVWRLWDSQINKGLDSKIIVGFKESDNSDVIQFPLKVDINAYKMCVDKSWLYYSLKGSHTLVDHPAIENADLIHLHNLHGGYFNPFSLSGISCAKPSVWTLHDMYPITGHCVFSFDCNRWERGCGDCPNLNYPVSLSFDSTANLLRHKKLIYDHSILNIVAPTKWMEKKVDKSVLAGHRIQTIYHGIDTNLYSIQDKMAVRKRLGIPVDKVIIGSVANGGAFGSPRKGGYYIKKCLEAFDESGIDYAFLNIGSENPREDNPQIINIGYVPEEEKMAELYSSMDIFLFPSLSESFGLVVIEAMSCGVPVIAFDCGAIGEIINDGENGFLIDYKDEQELIKATIKLATSESLRKAFASDARRTACRRFDFDRMVNEYHALYDDCMKEFNRKDKASKIFLPDMIPEEIKSDEFYNLENAKKGDHRNNEIMEKALGLSILDKPDIFILYNSSNSKKYRESSTYTSIMNQTYKKFTVYTKNIKDINIEDLGGDLIYYIDEGYVIEPNFLEDIVEQYTGGDIICYMNELFRENGTSFYKAVLPDIYKKDDVLYINSCKHNSIVFKKEYFINNLVQISNQKYLPIDIVDFLNLKLVKTKLSKYIEDITKSIRNERIFIYGAGGHTLDLLNNIDLSKINVCGIIDKNPELENTVAKGIKVYNKNKLKDLRADYIIISSASYEADIFEDLRKEYEEEKLVTIYGGVY